MNKMKRFLFTSLLAVLVLCFVGTANAVVSPIDVPDPKPVAEEMIGSGGITWMPKVGYARLIMTVARPNGTIFSKTFEGGSTPFLDLSGIYGDDSCDGVYTYELRVIPGTAAKVRKSAELAGLDKKDTPAERALTQTGNFTVRGGAIVTSGGAPEGLDRTHDVLHYDDVIITGSLCVGFDCANGESFGYDTVKLKENNLRLYFEDTSAGSFPSGDWRIRINDTTSGGASYFAVEDGTNGRTPFRIETGAPTHSLYVEDYGRIGLGTSIPYVELHIVDGDSPTIRLDQDGSSGWTAQRWDLCGNETNFFIRDVTNGSKLCFRIQPNTPSSTLNLKADGRVGIGTWSPAYPLEVETTGTGAIIAADRTDGATMELSATGNYGIIGTRNETTVYPVQVKVDGSVIMTVNKTGNYLSMVGGGTYNGTWNPSSSREVKENIDALTSTEAMVALEGLKPVKYNYKANKEEARVGFIAEEVPELVALNGRKSLGTVDIMAVLTKVVQEQQKTISELKKEIAELKKK